MHQEASDELLRVERLLPHAEVRPALRAVTGQETDAAVSDGEDAAVGNADAMRVAGEVLADCKRPSKRLLRVHDPLLEVEAILEAIELVTIRKVRDIAAEQERLLLVRVSTREQIEELATEDAREHLDRREEVRTRGDPRLPVEREPAAADDRMDVDVVPQLLRPGM